MLPMVSECCARFLDEKISASEEVVRLYLANSGPSPYSSPVHLALNVRLWYIIFDHMQGLHAERQWETASLVCSRADIDLEERQAEIDQLVHDLAKLER